MASGHGHRHNQSPAVRLARDSARRHGAFSHKHALDAGFTRAQVDRRVQRGVWEALYRRVYRLPGTPRSWLQQIMGACLLADGIASHASAARIWELQGFSKASIEVSTVRKVSSPAGVLIHRTVNIAPIDVTKRHFIPVTSPARTLLDLGAVADKEAVEAALEDALRRRLVTLRTLHQTLDRLGRRGQRGAATLRHLLDERSNAAPAESQLEIRLLRLLRRSGLPQPVRQWPIVEDGKVVARVDLAYPERGAAIEADGYIYDSELSDWRRDRRVQNLLMIHGWRVLRITSADLQTRSQGVVADIRLLLGL
jgi:very-short-patch-repair endonuclease